MTKLFLALFLILSLAVPTYALEVEAPKVPESGEHLMPNETYSFADGLLELLRSAVRLIRPDLAAAANVSLSVICAVMIVAVVRTFTGNTKLLTDLAGSLTIASVLLLNSESMIRLSTDTIQEMSDYLKLLYPVMASAMAAQGGVTTSTTLYTGTAIVDTLLGALISDVFIPMIYLFLAVATANCALGENLLKKMCDLIKNTISWCLKTILTVFTTYMSITGVISGTTDAAALKAAKVTVSSVVPVVGGILADTSEAILVSAGVLKNAAGIYGILAILAVFLDPFLRIGSHYLMLKITSAICGIWGSKEIIGLIEDFSAAMGLLLAMTGTVCLLLLISTVCFMKGVG